jgi:heparin binding hemagglutinin HbhA
MTEPTPIDGVRKPLYATVGAYDAAFNAIADLVTQVRDRAENTSTDVTSRVDEARDRVATLPADVQEQIEALRERLSSLPSELHEDIAELREKFTVEELRKAAESYLKVALDVYSDLAVRGEETVERLRTKPTVSERIEKVEGLYNDAVSRTEEALSKVSERTRTVGEQAAKLTGRSGGKAEATVADATDSVAEPIEAVEKKAPAKKAPAKKAPAKKAPAKKAPAAPAES